MTLERVPLEHRVVELLDRVLDKGIVIDAAARVAAGGIQLVGIDARFTIASFQTYLFHTAGGRDGSRTQPRRSVAAPSRAVASDMLEGAVDAGRADPAEKPASEEPPEPRVDGR